MHDRQLGENYKLNIIFCSYVQYYFRVHLVRVKIGGWKNGGEKNMRDVGWERYLVGVIWGEKMMGSHCFLPKPTTFLPPQIEAKWEEKRLDEIYPSTPSPIP